MQITLRGSFALRCMKIRRILLFCMLHAVRYAFVAHLRPNLESVEAYIHRRGIPKDMYAADRSQPPDTMCTLVDPEILYRVRGMNNFVEAGHQHRYCVEARSGMGKAIDKRTKRGPIALWIVMDLFAHSMIQFASNQMLALRLVLRVLFNYCSINTLLVDGSAVLTMGKGVRCHVSHRDQEIAALATAHLVLGIVSLPVLLVVRLVQDVRALIVSKTTRLARILVLKPLLSKRSSSLRGRERPS